jgi:hypothetical protein
VRADSQRANAPFRVALGLRVSEQHPLTLAGNVLLPQFFAQHPPYVAGARGDPNAIGDPQPQRGSVSAMGSAINAGYFENLRELAVGQALPMFLRHYYQGAPRQ